MGALPPGAAARRIDAAGNISDPSNTASITVPDSDKPSAPGNLRATAGTGKIDLSWRETASKIAIGMAGYVEPGPLRPPFLDIPQEVIELQRKKVERWQRLCAKYAPAYQSEPKRAAMA